MSITILPRSTWTSTVKGFTRISNRRLNPNDVVYLVPHYPAMGNVTVGPNPSLASTCQRLRGWRNLHVGTNGWADIGYGYGGDQAGRALELAGDTHAGAHAVGWNFKAIGYLFIVGNNERPSAKARATYRAVGRQLRKKFPNLRVVPIDHGRLSGNSTACAGQPIRRDIDAGNLNFGGTGSSTPAASGGSYTVRAGDTLGAIASANDTTVSALQSANSISNANLIRVGQKLTIPGGSSGSNSGGSGGSSSSGSSNSPNTSPKTGTGVSGRFLQTRSGGTVNIRSAPDSRSDNTIVGTVRGGELVRRDSSRDTQHFYGVGDRWYVGKSVASPVSAHGSNTLVIGDWPGREMPINGINSYEMNAAWRELLARVGISKGSRTAMMQRWLKSKGQNPGPVDGIEGPLTYRALQSYLNAQGFNAGAVDGIRGENTHRAEKRFLNSQIKHVGSKWPQHYRN